MVIINNVHYMIVQTNVNINKMEWETLVAGLLSTTDEQ